MLGRRQRQEPRSDPGPRELRRDAESGATVKIGLFLALFHDRSFEEALEAAKEAGCEAVEIATRGPHDEDDLAERAARHGLEVSALSCHGNPLHPDEEVAARADTEFRRTVRLAAEIGVETVITFSGCPGESEHSRRPSWVVCSWPDDYPETLEWQWRERVVPYWLEAAEFAHDHGVRVAIEPHPGFVVYNTATMLRLRDAGRVEPRSELRPVASLLAADRPGRICAGADGRDLPRPRQGHRASTRAVWHSTASSRQGRTRASEPGTSCRSETATRSSSGATSSPHYRRPATTASSRSSTRIRTARPPTVSREPSRPCAKHSADAGYGRRCLGNTRSGSSTCSQGGARPRAGASHRSRGRRNGTARDRRRAGSSDLSRLRSGDRRGR